MRLCLIVRESTSKNRGKGVVLPQNHHHRAALREAVKVDQIFGQIRFTNNNFTDEFTKASQQYSNKVKEYKEQVTLETAGWRQD